MVETPLVPEHVHDSRDEHVVHEPPISHAWKWMTVAGNAAIGVAELATGNFSTMSVTADGIHNVGDTATYYMQAEGVLDRTMSQQRQMRLRKAAHWIIAATSLGVGVKAGIDLSTSHESAPHAATMYTAGASLALNGLMLARLKQGLRRRGGEHTSVHEKDLAKHFWAVDIPSAALAVVGAGLQRYNIQTEQVLAVASGLVGAYAFRPTEANLAHNCLEHGHAHGVDHAHHGPRHAAPKPKSWLQRMRYKPRHAKGRVAV